MLSTPSVPEPGDLPEASRPYPVHLTADPPRDLSRWLWLVKGVLILPHLLALLVLWPVFVVLSLVALAAIVATGRYPRGIFDVNVGILRWSWRVGYYSFSALGTDVYPPFSLADDSGYPATFSVDYPERLSRGLALVKWWLLVLPHVIVVGLLVGPQVQWQNLDGNRFGTQVGLIGILVLAAGVLLLVRGTYPRGLHDLVLGLNRWCYRVAGYASLMTDTYPPFRLDVGAEPMPATPTGPHRS